MTTMQFQELMAVLGRIADAMEAISDNVGFVEETVKEVAQRLEEGDPI